MFYWIDKLGLKTKLILIMFSLSVISMGILLVIYSRAERELIRQVQRHTDELSAAIQISIEQLTNPDDEINDANLKKYMEMVRGKGIKQVSILSNDKEVIASSNPRQVGKKIEIKGDKIKTYTDVQEFMSISKGFRGGLKNYDVLLPVVVGNEQFGFVHIAMQFDDFAKLMRYNNFKRLIATGIVFVIGIIASIFLAARYTKPINNLASAAEKIASGDLTVTLPVKGGEEIRKLTENFNEMVKGLCETKELEAKLKEAEHLSKIGHLASGIAHEVRNPLNFINLSIAHIADRFAPDDENKKQEFLNAVANIKGEVQRLNAMIISFLDYGKPLKLKIQTVPINSVIDDILNLVRQKAVEQGISIEKRLSDGLLAPVDVQQIKTCVMNLILNSIQAVPENSGRIDIETSSRNGFISIMVSDNGAGIPDENLEKIYEPYFTTKETGIGLGLAITKRIVDKHGGNIDIKSECGRGATAIIKLPANKI
ncbi:MAG: HAMP domain-containing protein [Deltaproteobacteria bacterium]|nr:HAMP domain-containing protein [Deltaproteobacteria bacterium]